MGDPTDMPPLSGEIMAGDLPRGTQPQAAAADVVDAEFVTLPRGPAAAPASAMTVAEIPIVRPAFPLTGMDLLKHAAEPGDVSRRAGIGFWAAGLAAVVAAFWMSGGHTLSRHLPVLRGEDGCARRHARAILGLCPFPEMPRDAADARISRLTATPEAGLAHQARPDRLRGRLRQAKRLAAARPRTKPLAR